MVGESQGERDGDRSGEGEGAWARAGGMEGERAWREVERVHVMVF